jgi:hypothetical protein
MGRDPVALLLFGPDAPADTPDDAATALNTI